jgi:hypothetical protein
MRYDILMYTLNMPVLRAGSERCFHFYIDDERLHIMECHKCGRQITFDTWERGI